MILKIIFFLKWGFILLIIVIIFSIGGLYSYKFISTKDVSEEPDNLQIKTFKHKNILFKYGRKGDYPFLTKSYSEKKWKNINIGNFWINTFPDGFNYYSMESVQNTLWIECLHSCSKSDCETFIYDYYYSHDNGNTWESLNTKTDYKSYALSFKNDLEGSCHYEINNKIIYLATKDGGKMWE